MYSHGSVHQPHYAAPERHIVHLGGIPCYRTSPERLAPHDSPRISVEQCPRCFHSVSSLHMPLHLKTCSYFESPAELRSSVKYQPIGGSMLTAKDAVSRMSAEQYATYRDYPRYWLSVAARSSAAPASREYEMPAEIHEKPRAPVRRHGEKKFVEALEDSEAAEHVAAARLRHHEEPAQRPTKARFAPKHRSSRLVADAEGESGEDVVKAATRPPQKASKMLKAACGQCRQIFTMEELEWHAPRCKQAAKERERMEDEGMFKRGTRGTEQDVLATNPMVYSRENLQLLQRKGQLPTNVAEDRAMQEQRGRPASPTEAAYLSDSLTEPQPQPPPQPTPASHHSSPFTPAAEAAPAVSGVAARASQYPSATAIPAAPPQQYVSAAPPVVIAQPAPTAPQSGIFVSAPFPPPRHLTLKESLPELEALIKFVDHVRETDPRSKAKVREEEEQRAVQRVPSLKMPPPQAATPKQRATQSASSSDEDCSAPPKPPPAVITVDMYDGRQGTAKQRAMAARQNSSGPTMDSDDSRPLPRPSSIVEPVLEEAEEKDDEAQYAGGNPGDLLPCAQCGRKFRRDRLRKHTTVCKKNAAAAKKRGVFKQSRVDDPSRRLGGNDSGPFKLYGEAFSGGLGSDDKQRIKSNADQPWPLDRSTKTSDGRFPCPSCNRLFVEDAALRHFPICKRVTNNQQVRMKFH